MKRIAYVIFAATAVAVMCAADAHGGQSVRSADGVALEKGFASPPDSARPHVYYMIMNGNMSKECITAAFYYGC